MDPQHLAESSTPLVNRRGTVQGMLTAPPALRWLAASLAWAPAAYAAPPDAFWVAVGEVLIDMQNANLDHPEARIRNHRELAQGVQHNMAAIADDVREPLLLGIQLLRYSGLLVGAWGAFENLSVDERQKLVRRWFDIWPMPLQSAVMALRSLYAVVWYNDAASWHQTGYDGPWVSQ